MTGNWSDLYAATSYVSRAGDAASRFLELERTGPMTEPPGVTDDQWLAVVVLCLVDELQCELTEAVDIVDANRKPCLRSRALGIEPRELSEFMVEKMEQHEATTADGQTKRSD